MLDLIDNTALQALSYGIAVLGLSVAFRVLRYPDLTADGSFVLGAVTFAATLLSGSGWMIAVVAAVFVGAVAGAFTGVLHYWFGVSRLLTGILTSMIAYSLAFRVLDGRPNVGVSSFPTMFSGFSGWDDLGAALGIHPNELVVLLGFALLAGIATLLLLNTEFGLALRGTGGNLPLVRQLGHSTTLIQVSGLAIANALVALAAALVTANQGFADVNMGIGVIISLVAALVIGEEAIDRISGRLAKRNSGRIAAAFLGSAIYYFVSLLILRASIRGWIPVVITPTDLKMLSAVVVIVVIMLRRSRAAGEELLPL